MSVINVAQWRIFGPPHRFWLCEYHIPYSLFYSVIYRDQYVACEKNMGEMMKVHTKVYYFETDIISTKGV